MALGLTSIISPAWPFGGTLGGQGETVEADETWIGGKAHNRAFGPIPPKHAVAALVERDGRVRAFTVPNVTASNLAPIIARHVHPDTRFMTDESNVYGQLCTLQIHRQIGKLVFSLGPMVPRIHLSKGYQLSGLVRRA